MFDIFFYVQTHKNFRILIFEENFIVSGQEVSNLMSLNGRCLDK